MKKLLLLTVLMLGSFLAGCGLVDNYQQRNRRYHNILDLQARMMVDDMDMAIMADRPTYLTYWYVRDAE